MATYRLERMANLIREEVSRLILQGAVKDPRVDTLISVNRVEVSKDLDYARIYVGGFLDDEALENCAIGLNSASGFIQSRLAKVLKGRNTPRLTFYVDRSVQEGFEINQRLKELEQGNEQITPDERTDSTR